ncbi:MAG: hypothetical protein IKR84_07945 [Oscillibacter sp.]|nr:hypothetical protein [Oscillibacter sp.]
MDLAGFQPFDFSLGVPSVSITGHGVTFNKSTVLKLGSPEYVRLFINRKSKQIAVRVCEKSDTNAVRFYRQKKSGVMSVRWNHGGLLWELRTLLGTDLKNHGFRIYGEQTDCDTVLFDLNAAKPLE